jgi:Protein of unknown function (DUF2752)
MTGLPSNGQATRRRHRDMLAVAILALTGSFLLQVRTDDRVTPRFLTGWPLPPACMSQQLFGLRCPGCGMTRSFVDLAHGEWQAAWNHHRLGWVMWLTVLFQIPYRIASLRHPETPVLGKRFPGLFANLLVIALLGNWALEMMGF